MDKTIVIQNPAPFMTLRYIDQKALKDDFDAAATVNVVEKFGCPYKIFLTFDDAETCQKFLETYNGKSFEDNLN